MNATNRQQKKIGDRVKINSRQYRDQLGTLVAKERRAWVVELDDGIQVKVTFPMVVLIETSQVEDSSNQTPEAIDSGGTDATDISPDIAAMTVKELWVLAKQRGISVARTKADFHRIIKAMNTNEDLDQLIGKTLFNRVSELHISRLRSKTEMTRLLSQ